LTECTSDFPPINHFNILKLPGFGRRIALLKLFCELLRDGHVQDFLGPWISEFHTAWKNASRDLDGRTLRIDLRSLTVVSREGEEAIFDLMKQGAKFSCGGICTKYMVKRLARACQVKQPAGSRTV
jgi:hypothetical protein